MVCFTSIPEEGKKNEEWNSHFVWLQHHHQTRRGCAGLSSLVLLLYNNEVPLYHFRWIVSRSLLDIFEIYLFYSSLQSVFRDFWAEHSDILALICSSSSSQRHIFDTLKRSEEKHSTAARLSARWETLKRHFISVSGREVHSFDCWRWTVINYAIIEYNNEHREKKVKEKYKTRVVKVQRKT